MTNNFLKNHSSLKKPPLIIENNCDSSIDLFLSHHTQRIYILAKMLLWWFNYKIIILNIVIIVNVVECLDRCNSEEGINDQFWSRERQKCLPCTICHDLRKITLLGCGPERDTQCGTIEDLK